MLVAYIYFIILVAYNTVGNPLRISHNKGGYFEEAPLSNVQLLIPLKGKEQRVQNDVHDNVGVPGRLGVITSAPFSRIPDSDFVFDDTAIYFEDPKKTIKKDLSQERIFKENEPTLTGVQSVNKEATSRVNLLQKCQKYLQLEHLRSQWEPILKYPFKYKESEHEDHKLLLSLCRVHIRLLQKQSEGQLAGNSDITSALVDNVVVGGSGGVAGNMGLGGKGGYIEKEESIPGNTWGDKLSFTILNGIGTGNLGINGQGEVAGNAGFNGQGEEAGNVDFSGKGGKIGNLGEGGKGGLVVNGIGGQGGFFGNVGIGSMPNQYFDISSGGGHGNILFSFLTELQNQDANYKGKEVKKVNYNFPPSNLGKSLPSKVNKHPIPKTSHFDIPGNDGVAENQAIGGRDKKAVAEAYVENTDNAAMIEKSSGNLIVGENGSENVTFDGKGQIRNIIVKNEKVEKQHHKVARNNNKNDQNNIRCYVESLAYSGEGGQIGNLAISGRSLDQVVTKPCDHCTHIYLINYQMKERRAGSESSLVSAIAVNSSTDATTPPPEREVFVVSSSKFRPIGGRREWMSLDNKNDYRLRQYINNHKPWHFL